MILSLKENEEFTILESNGTLFIAVTETEPIGPYSLTPPGTLVTPSIEHWIMENDEEVEVDSSLKIIDANPIGYAKLVGQRPAKARRSK